ncbi:hypothetical protein GCM10010359_23280 [Streptomyces morookaense]|nr:hypothetical protein GCM10010359_23280 [Streptomyces morookaense]
MEEAHVAGGGVQRVVEACAGVGPTGGGGEVDDGKLVDHGVSHSVKARSHPVVTGWPAEPPQVCGSAGAGKRLGKQEKLAELEIQEEQKATARGAGRQREVSGGAATGHGRDADEVHVAALDEQIHIPEGNTSAPRRKPRERVGTVTPPVQPLPLSTTSVRS